MIHPLKTSKTVRAVAPKALVPGPPTAITERHSPQHQVIESIEPDGAIHNWARHAIWVLVFTIAASNAAVLAFLANIYAHNRSHDSFLWVCRLYYLYADANAFLRQYSMFVAYVYAILAAIFTFYAASLAWASLSTGRISFGTSVQFSRFRTLASFQRIGIALSIVEKLCLHPLISNISKLQQAFGVHGPLFEVRLLLDETIEIVTQTYCIYTASLSISNAPLNLCYAVVIFINTSSTLLVRQFYKRSLLKQRIAWLVSDFLLDFLWGTVIPVWMSFSLYKTYTVSNVITDYDVSANSTREVERVLVVSWVNFFASVIPFCNSFLSLAEIVTVLREQRWRFAERMGTIVPKQIKMVTVFHLLAAGYGTAVLYLTLDAHGMLLHTQKPVDKYTCMYPVYPWFSTKEACIGRRINCSDANINGTQAELDAVLVLFDEISLTDIYFADCSSMEFPTVLPRFHRLQAISIKTSTVQAWPVDLAPTKDRHPTLLAILLEDLSLPYGLPGMVSRPLTSSLQWLYMFNLANASSLFAQVEGTGFWQDILSFQCEYCRLTDIPEVFFEMPRLLLFSFTFNDIQSMRGDRPVPPHLLAGFLTGNSRLESLPDTLWHGMSKTAEVLFLPETNLSTVPSWLPDMARPDFRLVAAATPLCNEKDHLAPSFERILVCE